MRTTLTLDDDSFEIAQRFAKGRRISLGKAVSDLVRRSVSRRQQTKKVNGLTVFDLPSDSPRVTSDHVEKLQQEDL